MKISFAILAYNEQGQIGATIASLREQSLFKAAAPGAEMDRIELTCVANGCTDRTADEAREAFAAWAAADDGSPAIRFEVVEIELGDKSNAWNVFVHERSSADADYLGLIDADIRFTRPDTLENMVRLLIDDKVVRVVTDLPRKVIPERYRKSASGWFSAKTSSVSEPGPSVICGQLYVARAAVLREIWLPPGLPIEDGFIRACVVTGGFRHPDDHSLVRRATDAEHTYEGNATFVDAVRHSKQVMIGSVINAMLFSYLWAHGSEGTVKDLLRPRSGEGSRWLGEYIDEEVRRRGRWVVPGSFVYGRLAKLSGLPPFARMARLPVIAGGWLFDVYVAFLSNRAIRRGEGIRYRWRTSRPS